MKDLRVVKMNTTVVPKPEWTNLNPSKAINETEMWNLPKSLIQQLGVDS